VKVIRFLENKKFAFQNFVFKDGYWIAVGEDGYLYAGSGMQSGGLFLTYRLHQNAAPKEVGWQDLPLSREDAEYLELYGQGDVPELPNLNKEGSK